MTKKVLNFTKEDIDLAFEKVNPIMRKILTEDWVVNSIQIIGKKLKLRIDQIDFLQRMVALVMLDLIPLSSLAIVIETELNFSKEKSETIIKEIDKFIFTKVREEIRKEQEKKKQEQNEDVQEKEALNKQNSNKNETIYVDPYSEPID